MVEKEEYYNQELLVINWLSLRATEVAAVDELSQQQREFLYSDNRAGKRRWLQPRS